MNMKHSLFNSIKIIGLAAILAMGISYVHAFTGPGTGDVPPPLNNSADHQTKQGGLAAKFLLLVGPTGLNGLFTDPQPDLDGVILAKNLVKSVDGLFTNQVLLQGASSQLKIGDTQTIAATNIPADPSAPLFTGETTPLTVDLSGRGTPAQRGKNAMELLVGSSCQNTATTIVDTRGVKFQKDATGNAVDLVARQVRLNGGSPGANKVLVSTNANGDAVWATVRVSGGQIVYDYNGHTPAAGDSPVTTGQQCP